MAQSNSHAHAHAHGAELAHVTPIPILLGVFGALIVLTAITVAAAQIDLGELNFPLAMLIATIKALLVSLFFMHLWWDRGFNRIALFCGAVFFLLFVGITVMDSGAYQDEIIWKETVVGQPRPAGM